MLTLIWAEDENGAIGHRGALPWGKPIAADMRWFRRWTLDRVVIMGRRTWSSIGARPLPRRRNIVVSTRLAAQRGAAPDGDGPVEVAAGLHEALAMADGDAFVIGGAQLFAAALPQAARCVVTRIHAGFDADCWFPAPDWRAAFTRVERRDQAPGPDTPWPLSFEVWLRRESR